jgi:hypothetical protein
MWMIVSKLILWVICRPACNRTCYKAFWVFHGESSLHYDFLRVLLGCHILFTGNWSYDASTQLHWYFEAPVLRLKSEITTVHWYFEAPVLGLKSETTTEALLGRLCGFREVYFLWLSSALYIFFEGPCCVQLSLAVLNCDSQFPFGSYIERLSNWTIQSCKYPFPLILDLN